MNIPMGIHKFTYTIKYFMPHKNSELRGIDLAKYLDAMVALQ